MSWLREHPLADDGFRHPETINSVFQPPTGTMIKLLVLLLALVPAYAIAQEHPMVNDPGPLVERVDGQMRLVEDNNGDRIPDFSWVGYRHSNEPIPDAVVVKTVSPSADGRSDDRQRLQQAIDEVSARQRGGDGMRGAVLLQAGTYRISEPLRISASGMVLRGEGQHPDGTVIIMTALRTASGRRHMISLMGEAGLQEITGTRTRITQERVNVGVNEIQVENASGFRAGDVVVVHRGANDAWIADLGMGADRFQAPDRPWVPEDYHFHYERRIVAVEDNRLTIDAPVVLAIESRYGGGWVYKAEAPGRIEQSGVEQLRLVAEYEVGREEATVDRPGGTATEHAASGIMLNNIIDGWVRNVTGQHFSFSTVSLGRNAVRNTIMDNANLDMVGPVRGSMRYSFVNAGQQNLVMRNFSRDGRHDFAMSARVPGPNVFVDNVAHNALAATEPHHRFSSGVLYDNIKVTGPSASIDVGNRGDSGTGHGWSAAWTIMWNSGSNSMTVMDPPSARNFVVGWWPVPKVNRRVASRLNWYQARSLRKLQVDHHLIYLHPWSYAAHRGQIEPRSLFFHQLRQRLGADRIDWMLVDAQRNDDIVALEEYLLEKWR